MLPKRDQTGDKSNNDIVNVIEKNERGATVGLCVVKHTGTLAKGCNQSYSLNPQYCIVVFFLVTSVSMSSELSL